MTFDLLGVILMIAIKSYHSDDDCARQNLKGVLAVNENQTVRRAARAAGIPLWRVARAIGVSEPTLTRWLRVPLSEDKERRVMAAIAALEQEAG